MRLRADFLAKEFEVNADSALELLNKFSSKELEITDELIVSPEQREDIVLMLASHTAKCRSCSNEYYLEQKTCSCGKKLGRCPACQHYTSFRMRKKTLIGRDEYECERCDAQVAACASNCNKHCYQWAARNGTEWPSRCPVCQHNSPAMDERKPWWQSFLEGAGNGLEFLVRTSIENRQKKE